MKIAIVKYNAGNIQSVMYALERLGVVPVVTDNADELIAADRVIFPGVGEASSAMACLQEKNLDQVIRALKQPVLGICIGLHLLCEYSEEGDTHCIGVFKRRVLKFLPKMKVPHMGWNTFEGRSSLLFKGIPEAGYAYFVHGYYAETGPETIATTDYITPFSAALHQDNFYAVQFHPEKSGDVGALILENFLKL